MAKLTVFFIILFLVILSVLALNNNATVDISVWKDVTFTEIPVVAVIFMSAAAGIVSMFIISVIRDARRYVHNLQIQHRQKKEAKIRDLYARGLNAYFASRYDEAEELMTRVIEDDPAHLDALMRLGDIALIQDETVKARDLYLRAKEIDPKNLEVLLSLEELAESVQKWQDAVKYIDDILEIDDENVKFLRMKRDVYEKQKRWDDLIDVQHKILKTRLDPEEEEEENGNLTGYKYELGKYYIETGAVDKAVKTLKAVIKADKNFMPAYFAMFDAYKKEGNSRDARDILLKGYDTNASMVFLAKLEDYFIEEGEPGAIIDLYQKAIQKNEKDPWLKFFLAKLYFRLEMIDHALETVNSIDTTSFDYPELHVLLGSIYRRRAQFENAVDEYRKALAPGKALLVPFCCANCKYTSKEWSGRCPECRSWNTFVLDINEVCKIKK